MGDWTINGTLGWVYTRRCKHSLTVAPLREAGRDGEETAGEARKRLASQQPAVSTELQSCSVIMTKLGGDIC